MADNNNSERVFEFTSNKESYDEKRHTVISFISTSTPDYVHDIVLSSGLTFQKDAQGNDKRPTVLFAHNDSIPAPAKCTWIKVRDNGLVAETQFANTALGRDLEYLYANDFMRDFSIRLKPVRYDKDCIDENELGGVTFFKWYMPEYSLVNIGMNFEAETFGAEKLDTICKNLKSPELLPKFEELKFEFRIKSLEKFVFGSELNNETNMEEEVKKEKGIEERIKSLEDTIGEHEKTHKAYKDMIDDHEKRLKAMEDNEPDGDEAENEEDEEGKQLAKEKELKAKATKEFDELFKNIFKKEKV